VVRFFPNKLFLYHNRAGGKKNKKTDNVFSEVKENTKAASMQEKRIYSHVHIASSIFRKPSLIS
jgi:hypothetical protein